MNAGEGKRPTGTLDVATSVIANVAKSVGSDMNAQQIFSRASLIRAHLGDLEFAGVILARQEGLSWARIGNMLGLTRQAVHTRYATRLPRSLA